MASPFALFRKNQKILMAVFGIMAMVAFVLIDSMGNLNPPEDMKNPVVAETKDLKLTEQDIDLAIRNRSIVHQFLSRALAASVEKRQLLQLQQEMKGENIEALRAQIEAMRQGIEGQVRMAVMRRIGLTDERSIVDNLVLADMAKRSGVQVTDKRVVSFISEFINDFKFDPIDGDQLDKIANSMTGTSQRQLNEAFRTELLAGSMRDAWAANPAFAPNEFQIQPIATPIDRWNFYTRKNLRATAEVVAVRTADLVKADKVPKPQERELVAFYDEFKFDEPIPGSPDPGFKTPQKASFQYFAADEGKFLEPEKVTTAEIAEHYEKNKARYPYIPEDFSEPVKKEEPKVEKPAAATTPAVTTPATTTPAPTTPATTTPAVTPSATKPATPVATPTPTPSATAPAKPVPSASVPSTPAPSTPAPSASKPAASASATPSAGGSCEDDEAANDGCQAPAAGATATPTATATATPSATAKPSATPTATPSATPAASAAATPSATPVAAATPTPSATPTATPTGTAAAGVGALPPLQLPSDDVMLPDDIRTGRDPQYDPLWKVEDKIRKELAEAAVRKRIQTIFDELRSKINAKALTRPLDTPDDGKQALLYSAQEWSDLAKPYPGLTAVTTDLVGRLAVAAEADRPGIYHSTIGGRPFAQAVFSQRGVYTPMESIEIPESNSIEAIVSQRKTVSYLFWKTSDIQARTPELKEIHDEVELAWRTRAARGLALKEADEMAKRAVASPKPMAELFPDREVKLTNAFTWYKPDLSGGFGRQQMPTELSEVDNVDDPGPDFMEAVFSLNDNEITTAFNNPKTVCYVIRALTVNPPRARLYETFMADSFESYMQYGSSDAERLARDATKSMLTESGLRWLREPKEFDINQ